MRKTMLLTTDRADHALVVRSRFSLGSGDDPELAALFQLAGGRLRHQIAEREGAQPDLDAGFAQTLMRLDDVGASARQRGECRTCDLERVLPDPRRQLGAGTRRHHGLVQRRGARQCGVDSLLGGEQAFGHIRGRLATILEHKTLPPAARTWPGAVWFLDVGSPAV